MALWNEKRQEAVTWLIPCLVIGLESCKFAEFCSATPIIIGPTSEIQGPN